MVEPKLSTAFNELLKQVGSTRLPPVESWHPEREGQIDIRIRSDGTWLHDGTVIRRKSIAQIFSTILRIEDDTYYLVTPVEKLRIQVDDVPFLAVDMEASGTGIQQEVLFKTNMDDVIRLDDDHALTIKNTDSGPRPYIEVRRGLLARVLSDVFYRLADFVEDSEVEPVYIWSAGTRFRAS